MSVNVENHLTDFEKMQILQVKVLGIDLDGVVYEGNRLISGSSKAIERLVSLGYSIVFLTNNSFRSSNETEDKLKKLGINLEPITVINSIDAVIDLLFSLGVQKDGGIHVIGSPSLKQSIVESGYRLTSAKESNYLVVGFTPDFTYETVCSGLETINNGALFIACNEEANYPGENGLLKPGCGALVAAIAASAQHAPDYIAGKPSTIMLKKVAKMFKCSPNEILVIGDTLESDVLMANRFDSLSGWISKEKDVFSGNNRPTLIVNSLSELSDILSRDLDKR